MKSLLSRPAFAAVALALMLNAGAVHAASTPPPGFEDLAEKLLPTVVNVSTTTKVKTTERADMPDLPQLPQGTPFDQFFKDFYDQYRNAPPPEEKANALGSGFIIDAKNGYVVTNNHVIRDADEIKVVLQDNTSLDATLVGTDEKTDVAVLKIKIPADEKLTAITWGNSDKARVGSWVIAIGNPFGLGGTVTAGIVSARQRDIQAGPYDEFIQTDASINRGNSGGPMFNTDGDVVGMNTAIYSPSGGSVGIGFAIPSNLVQSVVDQLIKYGKTKRGWIGVKIQEVTPEIADGLGLDHAKGALVSSVTPKGPAETAGIESGDVILNFDGHPIKHMRELPLMVAQDEIGKKVPLVVWRKGGEKTLSLTLGQLEKAEETGLVETNAKKKKDDAKPSETDKTAIEGLGLSVAPLTAKMRDTYGLPKDVKGVAIVEVKKGGAADEKGLAIGDVISEVDQQDVATPKDVSGKIEAAQKAGKTSVLLFIARKNDMRFVAVKLPKK
jgi:serine protease Do